MVSDTIWMPKNVVALEMSMEHCFRTNNVRYTLPSSILTKWRGLRGLVGLLRRHGRVDPRDSQNPFASREVLLAGLVENVKGGVESAVALLQARAKLVQLPSPATPMH